MSRAIKISDISVPADRKRPLDESAVARLMESIKDIGLQTPVTVTPENEAFALVAGAHRLEACRRLGHTTIEAQFAVGWSDEDLEMWEIAENLHRAELTALERSEHIARWIELADFKRKSAEADKLVQDAPVSKGGRGKEGGVRAAERELGIEHTAAVRAVQIAKITPEAKQEAEKAGLSNSQRALLTIAKAAPEKQAEVARRYKVADDPVDDAQANERQVAALMNAWNKAGPDARQEFLARIDAPVMDARWGATA